ncbi:hypothetical protein G7054_g8177 [Neopestalotiopsis clavispora]|nr:hypothetical protein G7054_g8177 [Neopestalotiopsis clavispora]
MMSTSLRRTSTTTAPYLAVTTPFTPPQGCVDQFRTTSVVSSFWWNDYTTTTVKVLASDPGDSRFSACQPPGWNESAQFTFSPAVCPSGFTAYLLGHGLEWSLSTAYCCSSTIEGISTHACFKDIEESTTAATSQTPFPDGLSVHNAWHISWKFDDVRFLSPTPPLLHYTEVQLSSWVPGSTVDPDFLAGPCPNDCKTCSVEYQTRVFWATSVALPIVIFVLLITCTVVYVRRRRRRKRAKARAKAGRQPPAASITTSELPRE